MLSKPELNHTGNYVDNPYDRPQIIQQRTTQLKDWYPDFRFRNFTLPGRQTIRTIVVECPQHPLDFDAYEQKTKRQFSAHKTRIFRIC